MKTEASLLPIKHALIEAFFKIIARRSGFFCPLGVVLKFYEGSSMIVQSDMMGLVKPDQL